jgi:small subunit ribosomal protein S6
MVQHYELLLIYPGTQTDEEAAQRTEAVQGVLAQQGATVTLHEFWGKRKLAYEIDHIRHGFYDLFEFDIESTSLQALENTLRLNDQILRHQIVRKEVKSPERLASEAALRERIAAKREAAREQEQGASLATPAKEAPVETPPPQRHQIAQQS